MGDDQADLVHRSFVDAGGPDYRLIQEVFEATPLEAIWRHSAVAELAYRDRLHKVQCPTAIIAAATIR